MAYEIEVYIVIGDEYSYPCSVRCDYPGRHKLGTQILPLETAKILLITELPLSALDSDNITLKYSFCGTGNTYTLKVFER